MMSMHNQIALKKSGCELQSHGCLVHIVFELVKSIFQFLDQKGDEALLAGIGHEKEKAR